MDYGGGGGGGGCCRCCFSFIFSLGLTALFLWLSLRASKPSISVNLFEIPILNKTLDSTSNATVFVALRLANGNKDKGINYDDLNLTLSYLPNAPDRRGVIPIGNATVARFYQGHKKKATKRLNFSSAGFNWTGVRARLFENDSVAATFRVDLVTAVRFKIMAWRTKRHGIEVGADVEVNHLGTKVNEKGKVKKAVKLSAAGGRIGNSGFVAGLLVSFFGVWLLNGFW